MPSISHRTDLSQGFPRRAKSGLRALPARMIRRFVRWLEVWRHLRHVAELDEYLLRDIGLADVDADTRRRVVITGLHRDPTLKP